MICSTTLSQIRNSYLLTIMTIICRALPTNKATVAMGPTATCKPRFKSCRSSYQSISRSKSISEDSRCAATYSASAFTRCVRNRTGTTTKTKGVNQEKEYRYHVAIPKAFQAMWFERGTILKRKFSG